MSQQLKVFGTLLGTFESWDQYDEPTQIAYEDITLEPQFRDHFRGAIKLYGAMIDYNEGTMDVLFRESDQEGSIGAELFDLKRIIRHVESGSLSRAPVASSRVGGTLEGHEENDS